MQLIRELDNTFITGPSYVTVGVFDGVHRGHQQLISRMTQAAHANGALAAAYTFDPHPSTVLGRQPAPLLSTVEERAELLEILGLDYLVVPLFTPETVRMPAADFVDMLIRHLSMTELWAGPDFGLGYRRQGDLPFLRQLGAERGFDVRVVDRLMCNGMRVSSSSIRAALSRGDIAWATHCLGRPYRLTGVRDSETPRSDQSDWFFVNVPPERMVPATGVYACLAQVHSHHHAAVVRVDGAPDPADWPTTVRAHVVDLEVTASTDKIALDFIARLSGEHTPMQPTDEVPIGRYIEQARAWIEPHLPQPSRPCG